MVWNESLVRTLFPEGTGIVVYLLLSLVPALIGYVLGSVNIAVVISKLVYHDDIRKYGSGNAGTTNVMRTWGKGAAAATLIGDVLKGALAILLGRLFMGEDGMYLAGFAVICGHVWPCFFGFKGGKGVAATLGLVLFTEPLVALVLAIVFVGIVATTKFISLGSVMAVMMYPLVLNRIYTFIHHTEGVPIVPTLVSFCVMILVIVKHRENIQRLMKGKENKFSFKKSVKPGETASSGTVSQDEAVSGENAQSGEADTAVRGDKPDPNTSAKKMKKKK
ncbi:MAG: glycerol-3-phosphate 1-O-acyltransferase PlsY [Clostridia bacterium]|nr:glycerol-3-phosphate 1-O-acyltransferase PlsY [Clostridia bacterium]